MAIFNEGKVTEWIKNWIDKENKRLGYDKDEALKNSRKFYKKPEKKDESSQKKKGLLTKEDISNAISLIKQVVGGNSVVGKYLDVKSVSEIMKDYSISKYDYAFIGSLYTMDPDDAENEDVLIPSEEASWYDDKKHAGRADEIEDILDKLEDKLNKECAKKYGDSFEFGFNSSWYAEYYYIESKKPKTTSTNEAAEWHGKYFLSKEELHYPKFRSSQFKKVYAIIKNCLKSESFNKEFTAVPRMYDYFEDDDSNDVLKKWTYESKKSRVLSMCYFPDKETREDGTAKDSADFIMKAFAKAKKDDPKHTFGNLKYDEAHGQIDYKL